MLRHMIVAQSAMHKTRPDLNAHAELNCAYHRSGNLITGFLHSIANLAGLSAFSAKDR